MGRLDDIAVTSFLFPGAIFLILLRNNPIAWTSTSGDLTDVVVDQNDALVSDAKVEIQTTPKEETRQREPIGKACTVPFSSRLPAEFISAALGLENISRSE